MTRDAEGYVGIEEYAVIGDCRSLAMVATDGRIDWWPVVDPDQPPTFAAVVDPEEGGFLELAPTEPFEVSRRYLPGTNMLETTFTTASGTVRVTDLIPFGRNGNLAWSELIRRVQADDGAVPMRWVVRPGNRFRQVTAALRDGKSGPLIEVGDELLAVRAYDVGEPVVTEREVCGEFLASVGSPGVLAVVGARRAPVFLVGREAIEDHIALTEQRWRDWAESIGYDGPWAEEVRRSALALKLLTSIQTGAILAAPTTSLPERIGGSKNWDYRYMWVRDSSFTIDAFLTLGLHAEAQAAVQWLLAAVRSTAPELKVLYRLGGDPPDPERIVPLPGYRGSRPVRSGNGAAGQRQLGNFGDLFETIAMYVEGGHRLDRENAEVLANLADRCCTTWMLEDSGIWELKAQQHYTISKVGCWTALDRAVRLAGQGQLPEDRAERWAAVREDIKEWVGTNCWSADRNAYTWYAGTDQLDAAVLLLARTGFDRGERMAGTVTAIQAELADGPSVYRYSGAADEEGAFLACSFWLVEALVRLGDVSGARVAMEQALELRNDLGLMSEQIDPASGAMLGNFPQGLSHLALINAACAVDHAIRADLATQDD